MSIFSLRSFLSLALCLPVALPAQAQDTFVINLRGAEISVLAEQVSEITGRTLVLDPNLSGAHKSDHGANTRRSEPVGAWNGRRSNIGSTARIWSKMSACIAS